MQLTIDSLKTVGAFTGRPVKKEIKWEMNGVIHEATVYIKPLSFASTVNDFASLRGEIDFAAGRIASSVCDENGKPVFTVADITGEADAERGALDPNLSVALLGALTEVQNVGKPKQKSRKSLPIRKKSGVK